MVEADAQLLEARRRETVRGWFAIIIATVLMFFSYALFIFAFAAASEDEAVFAGGLLGIAAGLVPGVFVCATAVSQHPRMIRAALLATLLWLVIGGPIAIIDIPTGLVAGFGAGGVVAFRRSEAATPASRAVAVAFCVAYVFVLQRFIPAAGLMVGAVIPFVAIGAADMFNNRDAATPGGADRLPSP